MKKKQSLENKRRQMAHGVEIECKRSANFRAYVTRLLVVDSSTEILITQDVNHEQRHTNGYKVDIRA